ncbi:hypothetical protein ABZ656_39755 [Streptomyces sp. NPDC007095]|jgi:glycine cleavage system H protein|uniref:hypothetical protein n=1 Tax=Streptomyces sp. NPDC007095 TaxID=3154482 RepID=UPI000C70BC0B
MSLTTSGGKVRVGITDHAQKQLGDLVHVEQPNIGDRFDALSDEPELIIEDPYSVGWLVEISIKNRAPTAC